jgi:hypothetical protein
MQSIKKCFTLRVSPKLVQKALSLLKNRLIMKPKPLNKRLFKFLKACFKVGLTFRFAFLQKGFVGF